MKIHILKHVFFSCFYLLACNNNSKEVQPPLQTEQQQPKHQHETAVNDTAVLITSRAVLSALKNKEFIRLSTFFHPQLGVRFSPYGFVDITSDKVLYSHEFVRAIAANQKFYWGAYDGSGDSILLSVPAYYKRFLYNADFFNAEITSINKSQSHGNSINNIDKAYPGCKYTESYFSGFDKKYGGMDWTALRLVFKEEQGKLYLVAVVHDQWTT